MSNSRFKRRARAAIRKKMCRLWPVSAKMCGKTAMLPMQCFFLSGRTFYVLGPFRSVCFLLVLSSPFSSRRCALLCEVRVDLDRLPRFVIDDQLVPILE